MKLLIIGLFFVAAVAEAKNCDYQSVENDLRKGLQNNPRYSEVKVRAWPVYDSMNSLLHVEIYWKYEYTSQYFPGTRTQVGFGKQKPNCDLIESRSLDVF
ncbi:MAG: hypothetical protein ABL958_15870 [Bdellovibrionia bacterium]